MKRKPWIRITAFLIAQFFCLSSAAPSFATSTLRPRKLVNRVSLQFLQNSIDSTQGFAETRVAADGGKVPLASRLPEEEAPRLIGGDLLAFSTAFVPTIPPHLRLRPGEEKITGVTVNGRAQVFTQTAPVFDTNELNQLRSLYGRYREGKLTEEAGLNYARAVGIAGMVKTKTVEELTAFVEQGNPMAVIALEQKGCAFCGTTGEIISHIAYKRPADVDIETLSKILEVAGDNGLEHLVKEGERLFVAREEDVKIVNNQGEVLFTEYTGRDLKGVAWSASLGPKQIKRVLGYRELLHRSREAQRRSNQYADEIEDGPKKIYAKERGPKRHKAWKKWQLLLGWVKNARDDFKELRRQALDQRGELLQEVASEHFSQGTLDSRIRFQNHLLQFYLGGPEAFDNFFKGFFNLKRIVNLQAIFKNRELYGRLGELARKIRELIENEERKFEGKRKALSYFADMEVYRERIARLKDIEWFISRDVLGYIDNILALGGLTQESLETVGPHTFQALRAVNGALTAIDKRLETRGRDSLGIPVSVTLPDYQAYLKLVDGLSSAGLSEKFNERQKLKNLDNLSIRVQHSYQVNGDLKPDGPTTVTLVYKVAEPVGKLGFNVEKIRDYIQSDQIFRRLIQEPYHNIVVTAQSRWASTGGISLENAHPVDNRGRYDIDKGTEAVEQIWQLETKKIQKYGRNGNIFVILNGDIDNYNQRRKGNGFEYPNLTEEYETSYKEGKRFIDPSITTDTKLIPLRIEHYLAQGHDLEEAFRLAVNDFDGSFAIQMQSDLEPGKIYLAQQGEGQALYIGISEDGFHPASEQYGFVETTQKFIEMQAGQVVVLDQTNPPGVDNIKAIDFDGTRFKYTEANLQSTPITSRDIYLPEDRYNHFLQKEIYEAPGMWETTVSGKVLIETDEETGKTIPQVNLAEEQFPPRILEKLKKGEIKRIIITGMGTADAAGTVIAHMIRDYLERAGHGEISVEPIVATELSGFRLRPDMSDTLIIAISQSGKTADTNTTVSLAKSRKADVLGIVNNRDSKLTTYTHGVLYTGTGRDVEIAVASTKAFYAQIAAGMIYGMYIAQALSDESHLEKLRQRMIEDIQEMEAMPDKMRKFLDEVATAEAEYERHTIEGKVASHHPLVAAARYWPLRKAEWKILGSGPNYTAAKEGRIKVSELTYSSLPFDVVENFKHIDFSSESWVILSVANVRGLGGSWSSDIKSEIDKMVSHNAAVTLIIEENDHNFDKVEIQTETVGGEKVSTPVDLIRIPNTKEHFAPVLSTLAMHLLSYYIALVLNERANDFRDANTAILEKIAELKGKGQPASTILQDEEFQNVVKGQMSQLFLRFAQGIFNKGFTTDRSFTTTILLLAAAGEIPLHKMEEQFLGKPYNAEELLRAVPSFLIHQRKRLTRTVDSILHQAKFVTVGTKRRGVGEERGGSKDGGTKTTRDRGRQVTTNVLDGVKIERLGPVLNGSLQQKRRTVRELDHQVRVTGEPAAAQDGSNQGILQKRVRNPHSGLEIPLTVVEEWQDSGAYVGKKILERIRDTRNRDVELGLVLISGSSAQPIYAYLREHLQREDRRTVQSGTP